MSKQNLLFDHLKSSDQLNLFQERYDLPNYIQDNIGAPLRYYQEKALRYLHYTQVTRDADITYNHLLFHMATGSGKTLVLASSILYYFKEYGYQNFMFFVDSNPIVEKTRENLLNASSSKYLFNKNTLEIDGEQIKIEEVDSFPHTPNQNTIYIKLATIQKIHDELTTYRENGVTYEDLKDLKIILLGDEAHHFNAETKSSKKQVAEAKTWENTINKLLSLNPKNRLLEFTATIDLSKKELFNKYQNKIVYQYDLKQFMRDRFSKNVTLMRANDDDEHKMLDALLLSQYRKLIARKHGIENFKPIVMFKSNQIKVSEEKERAFIQLVQDLSETDVISHLERKRATLSGSKSIWLQVIEFYLNNPLKAIIEEIQEDFKPIHLLNANKQNMLEDNSILLNTLEEIDNPIRAIFAVAKLNEGWDVLNLFDIVRIQEKASTTRNSTDSEAQLIGRGARYYPFTYEEKPSYMRRFDHTQHELKIIETLHYHTINESAYIKNLTKSIDASNLVVSNDGDEIYLTAKLREGFKKSKIYNEGKIYQNRVIDVSNEKRTISNYGIELDWQTDFLPQSFENRIGEIADITARKQTIYPLAVDIRYLQKAIQKNSFYHYSNLKTYFPDLKGVVEFLTADEYLGNLSINVSLPDPIQIDDLTPTDKLSIIERFLTLTSTTIRRRFTRSKGTKIFEPRNIKDVIKDYTITLTPYDYIDGQITQKIRAENTIGRSWYIYDKAILNGLEHDLIDLFDKIVVKLRKKYKEVYLIRNDEKTTRFKLTEFDGYRGFMPDFILYMSDAEYNYQVIVEPKGEHLKEYDSWKEEFIEELTNSNDLEILGENQDIKLLGFKFYTGSNKDEFIEDIQNKVLDGEKIRTVQTLIEP